MDNCFYCTKNPPLDDLMIKIVDLPASTVYLFKEQTYKGRCNVVYHKHIANLFDLEESELNQFMDDVARVARAVNKLFSPAKINYGAYGDKLPHFHMHVVPKYENGASFGGVFEMNPQAVYLSDDEYIKMVNDIRNLLS